MNDKPFVIYHGSCADGFTAAWAVHKRFPNAEFHPGVYQTPPPDVTKRDVIFVDFCYKRAVMLELAAQASTVLVLDHHKSAAEDMAHDPPNIYRVDAWLHPDRVGTRDGWANFHSCNYQDINEGRGKTPMIYAAFDMNRSGAGIAWDFFHPGEERPAFINHVEDRDLWRFALPGTREIQAAIFSYEYNFANWDRFANANFLQRLEAEGNGIERKHHKDIAELVAVCQRRMVIGGYNVPVASLPYTLTSDAGFLMAEWESFSACYWDTAETRIFSLRSRDTGLDVSEIAKQYGGGGHRNAAGFAVPREHELARA